MGFYEDIKYKYYNSPAAAPRLSTVKSPQQPQASQSTSQNAPTTTPTPLSTQSRVIIPATNTIGGRIKAIAIANVIDSIDKILEQKQDKDIKVFFYYKDSENKYAYVDFTENKLEFHFINPDEVEKTPISSPFLGFVLHPHLDKDADIKLFEILSHDVFEKNCLNCMEKSDFVMPCVTMLPLLKHVGLLDKMSAGTSDAKEIGFYISNLSQYVLAMHEVEGGTGRLKTRTYAKKQKETKEPEAYLVSFSTQRLPDLPTVSYTADMRANQYLTNIFLQAMAFLNGESTKTINKKITEGLKMSKATFKAFQDFIDSYDRYTKIFSDKRSFSKSIYNHTSEHLFSKTINTPSTTSFFATSTTVPPVAPASSTSKDNFEHEMKSKWQTLFSEIITEWGSNYYSPIVKFANYYIPGGPKRDYLYVYRILKNINENHKNNPQSNIADIVNRTLISMTNSLINWVHEAVILDIIYQIYAIKTKNLSDKMFIDSLSFLSYIIFAPFGGNQYFSNIRKLHPLLVFYEFIAAYESIADDKDKEHFLRMLIRELDKYIRSIKSSARKDAFEFHGIIFEVIDKENVSLSIYKQSNINITNVNELQKYLAKPEIRQIADSIKIIFNIDKHDVFKSYIEKYVNFIVQNFQTAQIVYQEMENQRNSFYQINNAQVNINFTPLTNKQAVDEVAYLTLNNNNRLNFMYNIEPEIISACFATLEYFISNRGKIELSTDVVIDGEKLSNAYNPSASGGGTSTSGSGASASGSGQSLPVSGSFTPSDIFYNINQPIINNFSDLFNSIKEYETVVKAIADNGSIDLNNLSDNMPEVFKKLFDNIEISSSSDDIQRYLGAKIGRLITIDNISDKNNLYVLQTVIEKIIYVESLDANSQDKLITVLFSNLNSKEVAAMLDNIKKFIEKVMGNNAPSIDYYDPKNPNRSLKKRGVLMFGSDAIEEAYQIITNKAAPQVNKLVVVSVGDYTNTQTKELFRMIYKIYSHYYGNALNTKQFNKNKYAYFYIIDETAVSYNMNLMLFYRHLLLPSDMLIYPYDQDTAQIITSGDMYSKIDKFNQIYSDKFLKFVSASSIRGIFANKKAVYIDAEFIDQILMDIDANYDINLSGCTSMLPSMSPERIARTAYEVLKNGFVLLDSNKVSTSVPTVSVLSLKGPVHTIVYQITTDDNPEFTYFRNNANNYSYITLESDKNMNRLVDTIENAISYHKKEILGLINNLSNDLKVSMDRLDNDILYLVPHNIISKKVKAKQQTSRISKMINKIRQQPEQKVRSVEISEEDILNFIFVKSLPQMLYNTNPKEDRAYFFRLLSVISNLTGTYDDRLLSMMDKMPDTQEEYQHMFRLASKFISSKLKDIVKSDPIAKKYYSAERFRSAFMALIQGAFADPKSILESYGINEDTVTASHLQEVIERVFERINNTVPIILENLTRADTLSQVSRIVNIFIGKMLCDIRSRTSAQYITPADLQNIRYTFAFDDQIIAIVTSVLIYGVLSGHIRGGSSNNKFLNIIVNRLRIYNISEILSFKDIYLTVLNIFVSGFLPLQVFVTEMYGYNDKSYESFVAFMLLCLELTANFFELVATGLDLSHRIAAKYIVKEFERFRSSVKSEIEDTGIIFSDDLEIVNPEEEELMEAIMNTPIKWEQVTAIDLSKGVYVVGEYFLKNKLLEYIEENDGYFRFMMLNESTTADDILLNQLDEYVRPTGVFLVATKNLENIRSLVRSIMSSNQKTSVVAIVSSTLSHAEGLYTFGYSDLASKASDQLVARSKPPEAANGWLSRIVRWNFRNKVEIPVGAAMAKAKQWVETHKTTITEVVETAKYDVPSKISRGISKAISKFVPFLAI